MKYSNKIKCIDGNSAAAYVAYYFSEVSAIYPITPSSTMAEIIDAKANQGEKNLFGQVVNVVEMQSEAGAIAAVHGALQSGSLSTTFSSSQGLLLMIPNIYKMVGEFLPGVIHVASRAIATRSLSIFGDHQDINAVRQTGSMIFASSSVQNVVDIATIAHLTAIKASATVIHFFDGFRTSHEIQKIELLDPQIFKDLIDQKALEQFRKTAMNPHSNPVTRGMNENDDTYFQAREAQNSHFDNNLVIAKEYMKKISQITGRHHAPFVYYGADDAERLIIAMGSVVETIGEVVDYLTIRNQKVGYISVELYRPFSIDDLRNVIPSSVKKIAVLDRTKESGSREPLYLDVVNALSGMNIEIIGGRYGLSSKDTTPQDIKALFDHLNTDKLKKEFTLSIVDDVTNLSIPSDENFSLENEYYSCLFYGLGSDGTVSANKNIIKIIGDYTNLQVQAYFAYDSKKAGGTTRSHLRFGTKAIHSSYYIKEADFISISLDSFLIHYDILKNLKHGGKVLLNSPFPPSEIKKYLPKKFKADLAKKNAQFYVIDANNIAAEIGIGRRINTILQSAFFALNPQIIDYDKAKKYMKLKAKETYATKGEEIIELNFLAIEQGEKYHQVEVKEEWAEFKLIKAKKKKDFFETYAVPINSMQGNEMPVSMFMEGVINGSLESNTSFKEHRKIATQVPKWLSDNCIQCGICVYVCPHATIRAFLLTGEEIENAPQDFEKLKALGRDVGGLSYRIQVSVDNCVGCSLCVVECPGKNGKKALVMEDINQMMHEKALADYLYTKVSYKDQYFAKSSIKGVAFAKPYFEVSSACAGCGETTYYRLISQLFGKDMMIANATGCSSIYCAANPTSVFATDEQGKGIAWANSLFEDNAEFGFGMALSNQYQRTKVFDLLTEFNQHENEIVLNDFIEKFDDKMEVEKLYPQIIEVLNKSANPKANQLLSMKQHFINKSIWIIGGDGWAYDIGFGGLDHVLANNLNVNVLILDTEVYSNTGGQGSKSSPRASISKFNAGGKKTAKKDLGQILMTYSHIYVASIAMGANRNQCLKAIIEAESYQGPSVIIAYSPCIEHGIKGGLANHQLTQKKAVESGYWSLYRYDPRKEKALSIDYAKPNFDLYIDFVLSETRYSNLNNIYQESTYQFLIDSRNDAEKRFKRLVALSQI